MMEISELYNLLKTIQVGDRAIDVAYDHFTSPNQVPPFIVYVVDEVSTIPADDKVHYQENQYEIDLITETKDVELEHQLEALLNNNYLFYEKNEAYIDSEKIYQISYFI